MCFCSGCSGDACGNKGSLFFVYPTSGWIIWSSKINETLSMRMVFSCQAFQKPRRKIDFHYLGRQDMVDVHGFQLPKPAETKINRFSLSGLAGPSKSMENNNFHNGFQTPGPSKCHLETIMAVTSGLFGSIFENVIFIACFFCSGCSGDACGSKGCL